MDVKSIQKRLVELGFGDFQPTGFFGAKTTAAVRMFQAVSGLTIDGIAGPKTIAALFPVADNESDYLVVSQRAIDLIIFSEITSEANYTKNLTKPEWPGLGSGITIGLGYDLGYNSKEQISDDWKDLVSDFTLLVMKSVAGVKGSQAKARLKEVRNLIDIPYHPARKVFLERTLPRYAADTVKAFPGLQSLMPDAAGGLLSLVFNRGGATSGPRREEMGEIRLLVTTKNYSKIAEQVRAMKRLWDGVSANGQESRAGGLLIRRDKEAVLVEGAQRDYKQDELIFIRIK